MQEYFVDIQKLFKKDFLLFAHRKEGESAISPELLIEHTKRCEVYFLKIIEEKRLEKTLYRIFKKMFSPKEDCSPYLKSFMEITCNIVSFHDTGKANPLFQSKKMKNKIPGIEELPGVRDSNHSFLSSLVFIHYFLKKNFEKRGRVPSSEELVLFRLIFSAAYVISKHHGGLDEIGSFIAHFSEEGKAAFIMKELQEKGNPVFQDFVFFENEKNYTYIQNMWERTSKAFTEEQAIAFYSYIRLTHSLLVCSDYYATTEYMSDLFILNLGNLQDVQSILHAYENSNILKSIRSYEKKREVDLSSIKEINILRNEMFLDAEKALFSEIISSEKNIFFLEAPTGAGKSNISMNLSFQLVKKFNLTKIIYVYPFNTLVEQNISTLEKTFSGEERILKDITVINSITPVKEGRDEVDFYDKNYYQKILLDKQFLNYPFVLTTHVSLFFWMFSHIKEHIFCFHQLANSVIVIDEIQSYKSEIWPEIILFLKEFSEILNFKVLIMSATLPDLSILLGGHKEEKKIFSSLLTKKEVYYHNPLFKNRVKVNYDLLKKEKIQMGDLKQHILKTIDEVKNKKLIVEFIKKKTANLFYEEMQGLLEGENIDVEIMTSDTNQIERERILNKLKKDCEKSILLISTQVVEAGVDIDMDIGYKDIARVDSEEQLAGRINRSCKKEGVLYFFDLDDETKIYKNDVRALDSLSIRNPEIAALFEKKDFNSYYLKVLEKIKERKEEENNNNLSAFLEKTLSKNTNFKEISKRMRLIDENQDEIYLFFNQTLIIEETSYTGRDIFYEYKSLLEDCSLEYAEKRVRLAKAKSILNYFIYKIFRNQVKSGFRYDDQIGDIYYIDDERWIDEKGRIKKEFFVNSEESQEGTWI